MTTISRCACLGLIGGIALFSSCVTDYDAITLTLLDASVTTATIGWAQPGGMDSNGTWHCSDAYDLRYTMIAGQAFEEMTPVDPALVPPPTMDRGMPVQAVVTGLSSGVLYQFQMRGGFTDPTDGVYYNEDSNRIEVTTEVDSTPPDPVTDLAATPLDYGSVQLSWTATGDDGAVGAGMQYDVRYSWLGPIVSDAEFSAAAVAPGAPDPLASGSSQTFTIGGLEPATRYWFAIKPIDDGGNPSALPPTSPSATTAEWVAESSSSHKKGCLGSAGGGATLLVAGLAAILLLGVPRR